MKYSFPNGIPGFEDVKEFDVNLIPDTPHCFTMLSDKDNIVFFCIDPFSLDADYSPRLNPQDLEMLGEITEPLTHICILTLSHDASEITTANMKAPIVLNQTTKLGKQILGAKHYKIRHAVPNLYFRDLARGKP